MVSTWVILAALGIVLSVVGMAVPEGSRAQDLAFSLAAFAGAGALIAALVWL